MWGQAIGTGMSVGGSLLGGLFSQSANNDIADILAQAQQDVEKYEQERMDLIDSAAKNADARYRQYSKNAFPANEYQRRIIATEGGGLTDGQKQELDDIRRQSRAQLASSGLRGSGRAVTAALRNVESDALGRFTTENRNRAARASTQLSDQGYNAASRAIGTNVDAAYAKGDGLRAIGAARGGIALGNAGATSANARVMGQTIGDISSTIAQEAKNSKYLNSA